jgi:hypothetical protein
MEDAGDRLDTSVYNGHEAVDIRAFRGPRESSVFREHSIPEGLLSDQPGAEELTHKTPAHSI